MFCSMFAPGSVACRRLITVLNPSALSPASAVVSVAPPHATTASTLVKLVIPGRSIFCWAETARPAQTTRASTNERRMIEPPMADHTPCGRPVLPPSPVRLREGYVESAGALAAAEHPRMEPAGLKPRALLFDGDGDRLLHADAHRAAGGQNRWATLPGHRRRRA